MEYRGDGAQALAFRSVRRLRLLMFLFRGEEWAGPSPLPRAGAIAFKREAKTEGGATAPMYPRQNRIFRFR